MIGRRCAPVDLLHEGGSRAAYAPPSRSGQTYCVLGLSGSNDFIHLEIVSRVPAEMENICKKNKGFKKGPVFTRAARSRTIRNKPCPNQSLPNPERKANRQNKERSNGSVIATHRALGYRFARYRHRHLQSAFALFNNTRQGGDATAPSVG